MRIGQTSVIYFTMRTISSVIGFIATIYFSRLLGAGPLGVYYLALGVVSWVGVIGKVGIGSAVTKRVSEGTEREEYALAGVLLMMGGFLILTIGLLLARASVNAYIGYPATKYIISILFATFCWSTVGSILKGLQLVHTVGLLTPLKIGGRSIIQIGVVTASFGLAGLFVGHALGFVLVVLAGGVVITHRFNEISLPEERHFRELLDYAKYSWLGGLESRMFSYTDVVILGFYVSSQLIGIYSIAWNIAMFLILFSGSISTTVIPEISELSAQNDIQEIASLIEDVSSYAGLIMIPGVIGSLVLGEQILRIYGSEFTQGRVILVLLVFAALVRAYQKQFLSTLNAVDRPDLAFRVNLVFVLANLCLNIAAIHFYGWTGAAVATVLSTVLSLFISYQLLSEILTFVIPYRDIGLQWVAAALMGVVIYVGVHFENKYHLVGNNTMTVIGLVMGGAGLYFLTLLLISPNFRDVISANLPNNAILAQYYDGK